MQRAPRVLVIGAGFAGIGMAAALKRAGHQDFEILERADRVGGVWRENTYPGAACDVPSHLYSYSFALRPDWPERFSHGPDILAYLEGTVEHLGLRDHLRLGTAVEECVWDEDALRWRVRLAGGEVLTADVLVPGLGQLSEPSIPRIAGLERFRGPLFHSARWDHDVDLAGKRVVVVGTGASAIQFVPEIAKVAARTTVLQRHAPWVIPKAVGRYGPAKQRVYRRFPALQRAVRGAWYVYAESVTSAFMDNPEGMSRLLPAFRGLAHAQRFVQLRDPELRRKATPDYPMGCKRVLITNDWYRALSREDVDLETTGLREVDEAGVVLDDGRRVDADVIILGTGFRANEFLAPVRITGRDGVELHDHWGTAPSAHLGLAVERFPNLFLLYGPNTNLGFGSIVAMLEAQAGYVLSAIGHLAAGRARTLEVRPEAHARTDGELQARLARSVYAGGCNSWYVNASGRNTNNWPGWMTEYRRRTRQLDLSEFHTAPVREPAPVALAD
jgi:cation diffusion facilitator CzcD-associated flavoprotein CzcO